MSNPIKTLSIVLAVQVVLFIGIYSYQHSTANANIERTPLLSSAFDVADKVIINDSENSVELSKVGDKWKIDSYYDLPANMQKFNNLAQALLNAYADWPVATTAASAERLEVTEEKYQRRIVLKSGDNVLDEIYMGTAPTFRKVHARRAGEDKVYAIKFSTYVADQRSENWFEKKLMQPGGIVTKVESPLGLVFNRESDETDWQLADLKDGEDFDPESAKTILRRLLEIYATHVVKEEDAEKILKGKPVFSWKVVTADGDVVFDFYKDEFNEYSIKHSNFEKLFGISSFVGDNLDQQTRDMFMKVPEDEDAKETS